MDHFDEQPKFNIQAIIEQKPFENPAVQSFFTEWCKTNDSIQPQIINREDWERRGTNGILEKGQGKQNLYIPRDLQLWEMVSIAEAVDHDTFSVKPERQNEGKEKILNLGTTLQNTGIYIAQRLDSIYEGQEIARDLAEKFYTYGQSLIDRQEKSKKSEHINTIASHILTDQETEAVDKFLAGDSLYTSRQARAEKASIADPAKRNEFYETERRKTLAEFFNASTKAFELHKSKHESFQKETTNWLKNKIDGIANQKLKKQTIEQQDKSDAWITHQILLNKENLTSEEQIQKKQLEQILFTKKPWIGSSSLRSAFLTKIEKAITQTIETPKRELDQSIFRRGFDLLQKNMPFDMLPNHIKYSTLQWQHGETTLWEALELDKLKAELMDIRQSGNIAEITKKEKSITDKIQKAVNNFPHANEGTYKPSEIKASGYLNCLGSTILGSALMHKAGLNYLVGVVPKHSILLLVTSDNQVEWREMINTPFNENLTDRNIDGYKKDGSPLTVADIAAFSRHPTPEGLMFDIKGRIYRAIFPWVKKEKRQVISVFEPEYGQQIQILNSLGGALRALNHNEEAIEAYQKAIALDPKYSYPHSNLGGALRALNHNEEAIEAYQKAIALDPENADLYENLGIALYTLNHNEEAIEAYQKAITFDPKYYSPYNNLGNSLFILKRHGEAIEAYQKAIALDPKHPSAYYNLGGALRALNHNEEAIEAYQKFIDLAEKKTDDYLIKRATKIILELKK